jgi:hypothetical protein
MKNVLIIVLAILFNHVFIFAQGTTDMKGLHNKSHSMAGYLVDYTCGKGMVMGDVKKSDAKGARHTKDSTKRAVQRGTVLLQEVNFINLMVQATRKQKSI